MAQLTWTHTDARGLGAAIEQARMRARRGDWGGGAEATADARALLLGAFASAAALGGRAPLERDGALTLMPTVATPDAERAPFQRALLQGATVLYAQDGSPIELVTAGTVDTHDAAPPVVTAAGEAAIGWLAGAAIVVIGGYVAATVAYYFSQRNELESLKLASDERAQKHAAQLAAMTEVVDTHVRREEAAGQQLAWDQQEREMLERLQASTEQLARKENAPMQSVPDARGMTQAIGEGIRTGTSWALPLAVLVGGALLFLD